MDTQMIALVVAGLGGLGVLVWVLAKVGKALITIAEALAAAVVVVVVLLAVWLVVKAGVWALRQVFVHWWTSLAVVVLVVLVAWWHW
ncbi:MAG: cell division protein FtsK, partial [Actinobacteria bacterium]|nr:cell division protein FtsK [Actinomycetota bacterium]